jgi:hypothetical protein
MGTLAARLERVLRTQGLVCDGVTIGSDGDKTTWKVHPSALQPSAQPHITSFNPDDPAHLTADLDAVITQTLDAERLISAVVWSIIDTYSAPATIAKYQAARTKIITAYKGQPWKA